MLRFCSKDDPSYIPTDRKGLNVIRRAPRLASVRYCSHRQPGLVGKQRLSTRPASRRGYVRCLRFANMVLAVALILTLSSTAFADCGDSIKQGDTGPLIEALRTLAKVIVDTLIAVAAIVMVVGIATGFVAGQLLTTLGAPYGASTAMLRVVSVILLAIGAFLTTVIANTVIDTVAGMVPATEINVPVPGGSSSGYLPGILPVAYTWVKTLFS